MANQPAPNPNPDQSHRDRPTPPDQASQVPAEPMRSPQGEGPDRDTDAWEGAEPEDAVGLVDPRREIPNIPGL